MSQSTDAVLDRVLRTQLDVHAALEAAWCAAWEAVDPRLLELSRIRIAMLLGCTAELAIRTPAAVAAGFDERKAEHLAAWPRSALFDPVDRACLGFVEEFIFDVANLSDATAQQVTEHLGEAGLVNFTNAILVFEQRQRLRLMWEHLFASEVTTPNNNLGGTR